ncbi:jg9613 [Pararge aegeria aegeria]|uniref:Jg9613 protein n=1 Tax=Pararge aegeria aegeria TaxID=348720 RepID=A0A8S4RVD6_9NEOP|nr:jg9613 [Pararge aegeria aegeria]
MPCEMHLLRQGSNNAALTGTRSQFKHLETPTSIGSPSYVPGPLPLASRLLSFVGKSGSSPSPVACKDRIAFGTLVALVLTLRMWLSPSSHYRVILMYASKVPPIGLLE